MPTAHYTASHKYSPEHGHVIVVYSPILGGGHAAIDAFQLQKDGSVIALMAGILVNGKGLTCLRDFRSWLSAEYGQGVTFSL